MPLHDTSQPSPPGVAYSGFAPPTGGLAENFSRFTQVAGLAGTSGTLRMSLIWLPAGLKMTALNIINGATAESGGTHAWGALYDVNRNLLRQSADETGAAAVAASVAHAFTLTAPYVIPTAGYYYGGMVVVATTMPVPMSLAASQTVQYGVAPILGGNSASSGLTAAAPDPAGAITVNANPFYFYVT